MRGLNGGPDCGGLLKEHLEVIYLCQQLAGMMGMAPWRFAAFIRFAKVLCVLFLDSISLLHLHF
jgi:hypothetical protein